MAENACTPEGKSQQKVATGTGVKGVRLYMETGAYVVTDQDGLFHFEDVEARTHVVQIDETTIPDGYEPVQCEQNTRYAGSAISKFVDAQGGTVWRANFYLKNNNTEYGSTSNDRDGNDRDGNEVNAPKEHLKFGKDWLNQQPSGLDWAYPAQGQHPRRVLPISV